MFQDRNGVCVFWKMPSNNDQGAQTNSCLFTLLKSLAEKLRVSEFCLFVKQDCRV